MCYICFPFCTPSAPSVFGRTGRYFSLKSVNGVFTFFIQKYKTIFLNTDQNCISVYKENGRNADKHKGF